MSTNVSFLAAFVAGVFSIASPCCLPLIPIYLARITGVAVSDDIARSRQSLLAHAAAYVLGFSVVFIAFGAAFGAAGVLAGGLDAFKSNGYLVTRIGGVLVIVLGLQQLGFIRIPFMERTRRLDVSSANPGAISSSFLVGVSFGAGWSPCVGPILGAIMTMAAGQGSIERATLLLTVYSLGLAIPFLAIAFAFGSSRTFLHKLNRRLGAITTVSGAVMLAVGIIMLLGIYQRLFNDILRVAPWGPWEPTL